MLDATPPCRLDANQQDVGTADVATPMPCGSRPGWTVIVALPNSETKATTGLAEQGFEVYLPLTNVRRRLLPLFPRYAFLWLDGKTSWRPVLYTRGVFDLIRSRETGIPHIARAGAVEALQAGEAIRRIPQPPEALWRPGASVRLLGGGLNGHAGVITELGKHNALVAMMLFGHLRSVSVPLDSLRARDG